MTSKILIDATHHHEVRVAIVADQKIVHYDYDSLENHHKKGCIYKGIVSRIEPSLNAAFIDYGAQRHGFLPASEVSSLLYPKNARQDKPTIQDLLTKGQELIIQIEKDEIGNKGAALTTNISIAGCYIVLMPATSNAGGISRQIEGSDREHLMRLINQMDVPDNYSIIMRTASIGRSLDEILWDFNVLKSQWEAINLCANESKEPVLLYQEGAILSRIIRDYLKPSIDEILIDDKFVYEEVLKLVQHIRPDFLSLVTYFDKKKTSLFSFYGIEPLIESLFNSYVILENGATLVIDHREALTSIDINSARSTSGGNIETTAFQTNLAAAKEIARQICLRNIGGQIVIDFIDMASTEECRLVEEALKEALSNDKAKHHFCKISKLGLLQMSRQRLKTSLDAEQLTKCSNCHGHGKHRKPRPVALSILRLVEQESYQLKGHFFEVETHSHIAEFLFNEYRTELCDIERNAETKIKLKTSHHIGAGDYIINVIFDNKVVKKITNNPLANQSEQEIPQGHSHYLEKASTPALNTRTMFPNSPPNPRGVSWLQKIWSLFTPSTTTGELPKGPVGPIGQRSDKNKKRRSHQHNDSSSRNSEARFTRAESHDGHQERKAHHDRRRQEHPSQQQQTHELRQKQESRPKRPAREELDQLQQEPTKSMPAKRIHRPLKKMDGEQELPVVTPVLTETPVRENNTLPENSSFEQQDGRQNRGNHGRRRRSRNRKPNQSNATPTSSED